MVDIPLISVIIPVYNARKTIEYAASSVLNQANSNRIELLLVDDGSIDGSNCLLDQISSTHENVKVFHQENSGVSSARNLGIQFATGKYLAFLDSDDWWECGFLSDSIIDELKSSHSSDLYVFSYQKVSPNKKWKKTMRVESGTHVYDTPALSHIVSQFHSAFLYRRDYLESYGFYYLPTKVSEDVSFTQLCCTFAKSITCIDKVMLSYYMNYASVMHTKKNIEKFMEQYKAIFLAKEIYASHNLSYDIDRTLISLIVECLKDISAETSYAFVKELINRPEFSLLHERDIQPWWYLQKDVSLWRRKPFFAYLKCKVCGIPKNIKQGMILLPFTYPLAEFIQYRFIEKWEKI